MVKASRISEVNRNVCSFSLYEDCTIFFSAWLLNMKVFLVIKYKLLDNYI